jgi:tetraacyldisaccharide 4'-kinase
MMKEPWFWREKTLAARIVSASLTPAAALYDAVRRTRNALTRPYPAPLPVICIGNYSLGGVGKTPFALLLGKLLKSRGVDAHFITRGFGGALKGPIRVDVEAHSASDVGDEALLLAAMAPTWLSHDRPAGALAAKLAGAEAVIMDDGFQNPTLEKTFSFLLSEAGDGAGNGRLFPAGPLREPAAEALSRASAQVFIWANKDSQPRHQETAGLPTFNAWLEPAGEIKPRRVVAFCGIGRPERFFNSLTAAGFEIADCIAFPDHYPYSAATLRRLSKTASEKSARLITTEKDMTRISGLIRSRIDAFRVEMRCDNPEALAAMTLAAIGRHRRTQ